MIDLNKELDLTTLPRLLRSFLKDEAIGGRLILLAGIAALVIANTAWQTSYEQFWHLHFSIGIGDFGLSQDLRHWLNEGLMTLFFLVVGLEIKREIVSGELKALQTAFLPIVAAIGGMVVPALLYASINHSQAGSQGWAIPMATDIAFAVAVLALLGKRVSSKLKVFLLTLAIVDDIGAILVITLFYKQPIHFVGLLSAALFVLLIILLRHKKLMNVAVYGLLGFCLWLAVYASGINASIAGVLIGLLAPVSTHKLSRRPIAEQLERSLLPITTFLIVPLFAFANAGVTIKSSVFVDNNALLVAWGVIMGLVVGKVVGVVGATWLVVKLRLGKLPTGTNWSQFIGVGFLTGIGFTISIFVTELAFGQTRELAEAAKVGIIFASVVSAILGLVSLRRGFTEPK